jgi:transglutaminase-like putative cysteine protease
MLGLYNDIHVALATTFHLGPSIVPSQKVREKAGPEPLSQKLHGIEITSVEYYNIYPVFFKYYDKHPIGKATLKNWDDVEIENVQISFFVKQYMDNPKAAKTVERLGPGEEKEIDIYGLFTNKVLDITEGTSVSALLNVTYITEGEEVNKEYIETIRLENRNAVTWDDDRKACAFVTAKDPVVLKFAKNVAGNIKDNLYRGVDKNMVLAIALHETLDLYGITYVVDPATPYIEFSKNELAIDYLQFPKQTLEFMAGDCDDLSILYSSLLEAVGVETAFVTTPGHIFVAFALAMPPDDARGQFLYPDDLIYWGDKVWLPVEITERNKGFVQAWETGAKEWRESASEDVCGFFPMHEGWELYEPVGFPGVVSITMPAREQIASVFMKEIEGFVEREISPRVKDLQADLNRQPGNLHILNKIGVLYAKYGLYEKAVESFHQILSKTEYVPALVNTGNIYFLLQEFKRAQPYFERAEKMEPDNPKVLLCVARVNHELENYGLVREAYDRLKEVAPEIANRFVYLSLRGEEANRAADLNQVNGVVLWDEE